MMVATCNYFPTLGEHVLTVNDGVRCGGYYPVAVSCGPGARRWSIRRRLKLFRRAIICSVSVLESPEVESAEANHVDSFRAVSKT